MLFGSLIDFCIFCSIFCSIFCIIFYSIFCSIFCICICCIFYVAAARDRYESAPGAEQPRAVPAPLYRRRGCSYARRRR